MRYAQTLPETDITLLKICFIHNCLRYTWIFEDMLANVRLHLKDMVGSRAFAPMVVWTAVSSAITLPFRGFGHDTLKEQWPRIYNYGSQISSRHSQLHRV